MFLRSVLANPGISINTLEHEILPFREFPQYQPVLQLIHTTLTQRVSSQGADQPRTSELYTTLQKLLGYDLGSAMDVDGEWERDHAEHLLLEVQTYFEKWVLVRSWW